LRRRDTNARFFDGLRSGHREFVRWGKLIEGDIRNATALEAAFSTYKIDAVMHFAALAYVGASFVAPSDY
jgi:UDP-glucose 4-epimerase